MENQGEDEFGIHLKLFLWALLFTLIFIGVFIFYLVCGLRCKERVVEHIGGFLSVWSHCVGFALLNVIAHLQDMFVGYVGSRELLFWNLSAVWLVSVAIIPLLMRFLHISLLYSHGIHYFDEEESSTKRQEEIEELHEQLREFTGEGCALAFSWSFMRVMIALILGQVPNVFQATHDPKTFFQKQTLVLLASIFTLGAGVWAMLDKIVKHKVRPTTTLGKNVLAFSRVFLVNFFNMLAAWTWLQAIRWIFYEVDLGEEVTQPNHENLTLHITIAFTITFISLAIVPCITNLARGTIGLLADFVLITAILSAFSWEISLDILVEVLNKDASGLPVPWNTLLAPQFLGSPVFSLVMFSVMLAVLLPLYIFGIYPLTKAKTFAHALKHRDDAELSEEIEEESEPESDEEHHHH